MIFEDIIIGLKQAIAIQEGSDMYWKEVNGATNIMYKCPICGKGIHTEDEYILKCPYCHQQLKYK